MLGVPRWSSLVDSPMSRLSKRTTRKPLSTSIWQSSSGHRTSCTPSPITSRITGSCGLPSDSYSKERPLAEICGTVGVAVEPLSPAAPMERPPLALALPEAIGHRVPRRRMHADAEVARLYLDALGAFVGLLQAALPRDDAVATAEYRRRGYGRSLAHARHRDVVVEAVAAHHLVEAPCVVGLGMAGEGAPERDHAAHVLGRDLGDLARIHASEAPADEAHLAPARLPQPTHVLEASLQHTLARAEVEAQVPAVRVVAAVHEEGAQRQGGEVGCAQAGEDDDGMPVATRRTAQHGPGGERRAQLPGRAPLEREQERSRSLHRFRPTAHRFLPFVFVALRSSLCAAARCRAKPRRSGIADFAATRPKSSEPL